MTVTNCKYYIGGGKKTLRLRKNQNINLEHWVGLFNMRRMGMYEWSDEQIMAYLNSSGRIQTSKTSKVLR
jgi:hypothetical protein